MRKVSTMCNIGAENKKANWVENVITGTTGLLKQSQHSAFWLCLLLSIQASLRQTHKAGTVVELNSLTFR